MARALKGEDIVSKLRVRKGLIVVQLALSVVVLVCAALFTQTVKKLHLVDPGFERDRVLLASTATDGYSAERRKIFYARLLDEVRGIPGVVSAALANDAPLDVNTGWNILVQRDPAGPPRQAGASVAFISPDYFKTMGIPLVKGRDFDERDETGAHRAVIVNENFVKTYLAPGRDPIGASVIGNGNMTFDIVGVVKDSASIGLRDLDQHMLYVPRAQALLPVQGVLHVRSVAPPASLTASVEAAVRRIDPNVPVFNLLLQIAGVLHLGLMCAGLLMPQVVGIRAHLARLPPFIRQLFWVYYSFIALCLVSFSIITIVFADTLAAGGNLARALCVFFALFWMLRLIAGTFIFDMRPYLTNSYRRLGYQAINVVFAYLPVVYALAAAQPAWLK